MKSLRLFFSLLVLALFSCDSSQPEQKEIPVKETEHTLQTARCELKGSLVLPDSAEAKSLVIIIAGSGPTDRNNNTPLIKGSNDAFKMLSRELADQNIATFRYDKRLIAESKCENIEEKDMSFDFFINDAVSWVKYFRAQKQFDKIGIFGHSQGSLVGIEACIETKVDFLISASGPGESIDKVIQAQLVGQKFDKKMVERIISEIREGKDPENIPDELKALFKPSLRPFFRSWFKYNPHDEIKKVSNPIMILHGESDPQVPVAQADILSKASPKSKKVVIPGMNHILKAHNESDPYESYMDPSFPLSPGMSDSLATFVRSCENK